MESVLSLMESVGAMVCIAYRVLILIANCVFYNACKYMIICDTALNL